MPSQRDEHPTGHCTPLMRGPPRRTNLHETFELRAMLGAPRIRQQMVDAGSCDVLDSRVKRWTPRCYARSGPRKFVRTAELYGEGLDANGTRRVYDVETRSDVPYFSFYRRYPDGGMVVDVPPRKRHAEALMGQACCPPSRARYHECFFAISATLALSRGKGSPPGHSITSITLIGGCFCVH